MKKVEKLVRDNIPKIIKDSGKKPIFRNLDEEEYIEALLEKMYEEVNELLNAQGPEDTLEQLGDIAVVMTHMIDTIPALYEQIMEKNKVKGEFSHKIYLEGVEDA